MGIGAWFRAWAAPQVYRFDTSKDALPALVEEQLRAIVESPALYDAEAREAARLELQARKEAAGPDTRGEQAAPKVPGRPQEPGAHRLGSCAMCSGIDALGRYCFHPAVEKIDYEVGDRRRVVDGIRTVVGETRYSSACIVQVDICDGCLERIRRRHRRNNVVGLVVSLPLTFSMFVIFGLFGLMAAVGGLHYLARSNKSEHGDNLAGNLVGGPQSRPAATLSPWGMTQGFVTRKRLEQLQRRP